MLVADDRISSVAAATAVVSALSLARMDALATRSAGGRREGVEHLAAWRSRATTTAGSCTDSSGAPVER